jgi:hypothetical protein
VVWSSWAPVELRKDEAWNWKMAVIGSEILYYTIGLRSDRGGADLADLTVAVQGPVVRKGTELAGGISGPRGQPGRFGP